jgi:hypothetical protein
MISSVANVALLSLACMGANAQPRSHNILAQYRRQEQIPTANVIQPSSIKIHDIITNANSNASYTSVKRTNAGETSTIYEFPIPAETKGSLCGLFMFQSDRTDVIMGGPSVDIFESGITDLASQEEGNLRQNKLGRMTWDSTIKSYIAEADPASAISFFPCPVGETLHWEAVAVGEYSLHLIKQDLEASGGPNGVGLFYITPEDVPSEPVAKQ